MDQEQCDTLVVRALEDDPEAIRSLALVAGSIGASDEVINTCLDCLGLLATHDRPGQTLAQTMLVHVLSDAPFIRHEVSRVVLRDSDTEVGLQMASEAIAEALPSFNRQSNVRSWACRIARNTAMQMLRSRRETKAPVVDLREPASTDETSDDENLVVSMPETPAGDVVIAVNESSTDDHHLTS